MVVANSGRVQNASFPASQNNSNLNVNTVQNNKMTAKGVLICRDNSHPFQDRTLTLEQSVKIGRSVARARAAQNNAIFDCKVLSRNHALLWYSGGKFYLQDTRSSNGTFVNNQRLSAAGVESTPKEVCSGDIVQFGVDVIENTKKVTHGCIVATLKLYLPDGKEAKASVSTSVASSNISYEDLYMLNQVIQEATKREKALYSKLGYLQQLVSNTRKAANESWKALIAEDQLLSWVETIESQLAVYSKNYTEDKIRNELIQLQEEKAEYQNAAKEALQKVLQEKLEISQRLVQLEGRLSETEEECQSLHNVAKYTQTELQELSSKFTKLTESEEEMKDMVQHIEQEKQELLKKLEDRFKIENHLHVKLRNFQRNSLNVYKLVTALKNKMQILQDTNSKLVTSEIMDSKYEGNPIEAINTILNTMHSVYANEMILDPESIRCHMNDEQDNQINLQDIDSNQLKNSDIPFSKEQLDDSFNNDNITEYILPPPSRKTMVNGNVNIDNSDINSESETNSEATDDTCSITSDDTSEKSVIEVKKEEPAYDVVEQICALRELEVRFAREGQLQVARHPQITQKAKDSEETEINVDSMNNAKSLIEPDSTEVQQHEKKDETAKDSNQLGEECEEKHLEGDYVKTLKPLSKNDTQQNLHTREYVLQTLIGSLDSLKVEDNLESQQAVKKELENLKDWLICEPHEEVIGKLKELYYCAKNESQRTQELHEELVILKEKYNVFVEEKAELSKKYTSLKAQCGDLLNTTYAVPIHYVAPIAIILVWMLLEKIF
ncbi:sarcolemmal membrane-associated protein [Hylaeus anthracinus]|uniref:sarcolemmal membrane-associated protein n=1 Tax=Hylaeus volcanicus TaxID=313075 RepID=UPI0023B83FDC|nr:sarcolemmal membrane-associated protein [Hylaeus volcanicus]XP_054004836.1 sarcolemmal membrane-associated protein [Hylaeus anthracinus]